MIPHKRPKNGRQLLRTVERTARRPKIHHHEPTPIEQPESVSSSDAEDDNVDNHDPTMAYNALLTLLKTSHPPVKKKARLDAKEEQQEVREEEQDQQEEEEEEQEEEEEDNSLSDDEQVQSIQTDPFEVHFNLISEEYIDKEANLIKQGKKWNASASYKNLGIPGYTPTLETAPGNSIEIPSLRSGAKGELRDYGVKQRVCSAFAATFPGTLLALDHAIARPMLEYRDVSFPYRDYTQTLYRPLYVAHILNHIYKTRDRIIKNTQKIHAYREAERAGTTENMGPEPELRDQGFTRPKVLCLLPTRDACHQVVSHLIAISGSEQQENKKKFETQFHSAATPPENKPADFIDAFRGNSNDFFCIGVKLTRKTLKLYSSFYSSDIILASPIGLAMILENPDKKKRQQDFLSSIEVLVIDRAHHIEMQNWDHVATILKYVNAVPKESHDADFSRVRMWSINDQAPLLRQTLVFSEYMTPTIMSSISRSRNLGGKVRFKPHFDSATCVMNSIGLQVKQIFQRFDSELPVSDPDTRFKFFVNVSLPALERSTSYPDGILIYIPSYYDYLRVKRHLKLLTKLLFGSLDEYSSQSKVTRTRQLFVEGRIKILVYTERLHHFRRFEISGVKTLLMYGPPSNPLFYKDMVRFIAKSVFREIADLDLAFVKVMFSKWDATALERIVGEDRAPALCGSSTEMFEFR